MSLLYVVLPEFAVKTKFNPQFLGRYVNITYQVGIISSGPLNLYCYYHITVRLLSITNDLIDVKTTFYGLNNKNVIKPSVLFLGAIFRTVFELFAFFFLYVCGQP